MRAMFRIIAAVFASCLAVQGVAQDAGQDAGQNAGQNADQDSAALADASPPAITEAEVRAGLEVGPDIGLAYRDLDCRPITFAEFAEAMRADGMMSKVERAIDGSHLTVTLHRRGGMNCPSPYPPITEMPPFDLRDLAGRRVTAASLKGKPTLMNFYFAQCVPCIREVGPLNDFLKSRQDLNFLAVTFDDPDEARDFVKRFGFRWRVVPDARDFIDRMRVANYPLMALFDADGRLLGTKRTGARDELEAAALLPQLRRWVDGLLRGQPVP